MSAGNRLFLAFAICAALAAPPFGAQAAQQGVTDDTITIGAFGPITGPAAYIGLAGRDGAGLAIKEINAAGGINGRKLNMIFEDDGHSPAKALAAVKKLVDDDKVFMLFNVAGSNGTIDYAKENGLVMFVSFASAPAVTGRSPRISFAAVPPKCRVTASFTPSTLSTVSRRKRSASSAAARNIPKTKAMRSPSNCRNGTDKSTSHFLRDHMSRVRQDDLHGDRAEANAKC